MKNENLNIRKASILFVVYFFLLMFPWSRQAVINFANTLTKNGFAINLMVYALPVTIGLIFYGKEVYYDFNYFNNKRKNKTWAVFVFFIFVLSLNGILNAITENFGDSKNQAAVVDASKQAPLLLVILLFVILGPFLEEVIFRKILITELSQIIDKRIAISLSISSFVLIHVHQPIDIINYLPVAVVFTYAYLKSGQHLSFSLSIHVMNNAFAVLFPLLIN